LSKLLKNWIPFPSKGDLANHYRQVESLLGVYSLLNNGYSLGPLRGWAISPDTLNQVLRIIASYSRPTIVEFGSGQSTIAICKWLSANSGQLISVEHDAKYSKQIELLLTTYNLGAPVRTVIAPLAKNSAGEMTYSMDLIPEVSPDIVFVDGPPGKGKNRMAPLQWAYSKLAPNGVILLDDYIREDEKICIRCLLEEHPTAEVQEFQVEKGLIAVRKPSR